MARETEAGAIIENLSSCDPCSTWQFNREPEAGTLIENLSSCDHCSTWRFNRDGALIENLKLAL